MHPDWRSPDQAATLLAVLAGHTTTADDCFVAPWKGLGEPPPVAEAPVVELPHRSGRAAARVRVRPRDRRVRPLAGLRSG